ncbi:hypothetical protein Tco_0943444 [Tanacetum coccineum]
MANVLSTIGATNILASEGLKEVFTTASPQVPPASSLVPLASATIATAVATASEGHPTATTRVKKKIQEQMSKQAARRLEQEFSQEDQAIREQVVRDEEIARIQAEENLRQMIDEIDRSNENMAQVKKYQAQQQKLESRTERRKFYSSVLKIHARWKTKDFKGMSFKQIEEAFIPVWESVQDFVPMDSKEESERFKRPGTLLEKMKAKRLKTAKSSGSDLSDEELKNMMELVPVEDVYIEALAVKRPIITWYVHTDGLIKRWKIVRVGKLAELHQTFEDMLKRFDREDLDKLWSLVQETHNSGYLLDDKEKEIWVELKRLYDPDPKDQLWALQKYMHDPLEWRLYDTCGVHHVSTIRGHEIFMLVEKDYPLTKGLTTVMISNKLQVDQYSEMANDLLVKIYNIANSLRQRSV